jgi:cytosine/adenosine deaminase-related metal-dependent hydrolase
VPLPQFSHALAHEYILENLPPDSHILFIHCLEATQAEIDQLGARYPNAYFCLSPKSNEYIHGKVPDISHFDSVQDRICLGTDSLASNTSLRMIEEIQCLHQHFPDVSVHTLLNWATTQGAAALQKSDAFGAFMPSQKPGVNLLEGIDVELMDLGEGRVMKLY